MTVPAARERSEIPVKFTWNAPSVFPSIEAWSAEVQAVTRDLGLLGRWEGHLKEGPATLVPALAEIDALNSRVAKIVVYAGLAHSVDTTDQAAAGMNSQARVLYARAQAASAFLNPELLAIGRPMLESWIRLEEKLVSYSHFVEDLFRNQAHVRSTEVEQILGLLADPFSGPGITAGMLTNADFQFEPATTSAGDEIPLDQSAFHRIMNEADRATRQTAWESYYGQYHSFKNTLASNLMTSVKQNVVVMRVRRYPSTLAMALADDNVPSDVYHNLLDTFRRNLPTWHRYFRLRRKALGYDKLYPYDIWAPLTHVRPKVPFSQAVDWICEGLEPMGQPYVDTIRQGCLRDRWVDIYPNKGKSAGAFSWGTQGTFPFIVMSYTDSIMSMSTLAHELGHSMHSYLSWSHQGYRNSQYSLFVAETASNFHQAMVRAHLLATNPDRDFQISLIEEAMSNFYRYFFIMPTLARFELETHERVERGEGLTADGMIELMADLYDEGYGGEVAVDRTRVGMVWASFSHLYTNFYVFQYATGISAANALARRILDGVSGAAQDYIRFLESGGSLYPLEALRLAGVDLARPDPIDAAFQVLSGLVDRLEKLF